MPQTNRLLHRHLRVPAYCRLNLLQRPKYVLHKITVAHNMWLAHCTTFVALVKVPVEQ